MCFDTLAMPLVANHIFEFTPYYSSKRSLKLGQTSQPKHQNARAAEKTKTCCGEAAGNGDGLPRFWEAAGGKTWEQE